MISVIKTSHCIGKLSLFVLRVIPNTGIHCVVSVEYLNFQQMVRIVATSF
jgi:hypothetical protein